MNPVVADLNTKGGRLLALLAKLDKSCIWCNKKCKLGKYDKSKGISSLFSDEFVQHVHSTHGYHPDILSALLNSYLDNTL